MSFVGLAEFIPDILQGLFMSIYITILGMVMGSLLGLFAAIAKGSNHFVLRKIGSAYIELFRNTPLLVQIYLLYFGLGQLGITISAFGVAFIGLTLNNGAYVAEIIRAGIQTVGKGLKEAGFALGLNHSQVFRSIVLPPAIKSVFPAWINQFVLLFLFSSITSVISFGDLTYQIMNIASQTAKTFEIFIIGTIIYYVTSTIFVQLSELIERKVFKW